MLIVGRHYTLDIVKFELLESGIWDLDDEEKEIFENNKKAKCTSMIISSDCNFKYQVKFEGSKQYFNYNERMIELFKEYNLFIQEEMEL